MLGKIESFLSKKPCDFSEAAALHQRGQSGAGILDKFQVVFLGQVLAHGTERDVFLPLPGQLRVEASVRGDDRVRETADVVGRNVPGKAAGQNVMGTKLRRVYWIASLGCLEVEHIGTARIQVHVKLLESVTGTQNPISRNLPI